MGRSKKSQSTINLDMAFFKELVRFYKNNKPQIRRHYKLLTRTILDYNDPDRYRPGQFLRRPQFEALEIYVFLKEYLDNKPVYEIFDVWYHKNGPFQNRKNVNGIDGGLVLDEHFLFDSEAYDRVFKKMQASRQIYSNYIFALTMGVGKTLLMATCIFYEFMLANKFPQDVRFCHNALIFAPDKTVLQSLREIERFDFSKVLPPEHANWMQANLKLHYLDEAGTTLNVTNDSGFNLIVSNTQKIILKKKNAVTAPVTQLFHGEFAGTGGDAQKSVYDDIADLYGLDEPMDENDLTTNQRFLKLRCLPQLGIYVDEAHHAFGDKLKKDLQDVTKETSLRFTINALAQGLKSNKSRLVACYNFTGTPYIKNEVLPEVVYAFGLGAAISDGYLKNPVIHSFTNTRDRDFVKMVIEDFLKAYKGKRFEGLLPKLAFFSPTIEDANQTLKPMIEGELAKHNISSKSILLNVGDERLTSNDDIKAFNGLDSPKSDKQFIILVNKGKEGWNCRSLCGVAMFRKPKSKIFVLQATMRCLRSIGKKQEDGNIYLSKNNYQILDDELQQNFRLNADEFQKQKKKSELFEVRVLRKEKIKISHVKHQYELKEKDNSSPINFEIDSWDTDKYRAYHERQKLSHCKLESQNNAEEVTAQKIHRTWSAYTLTAEIARYLCISPIKVEKILRESVDGIDALLVKINQFNELLYDKLIPFIFDQLYEIEEYEKKDTKDILLVNDPEGGSFFIHGKNELSDFYDEWLSKDPAKAGKSFHLDKYIFDSQPEKDFFERIINLDEIKEIFFTGMLTHGQSDFYINYIDPDTKNVRCYYPDFLIKTKSGEYLVIEVKASNQIDDPVVQAKKSFAEDFLRESGIRYQMVSHNEVIAVDIINNNKIEQQSICELYNL